MATKYRVVIRGLKPGESANLVAIRLGTLFKLPPEKVVPVLSRPGTPIKAGIDLERAVKYQVALENAGCDCIVEPDVAQEETLSIDPDALQSVSKQSPAQVGQSPPSTGSDASRTPSFLGVPGDASRQRSMLRNVGILGVVVVVLGFFAYILSKDNRKSHPTVSAQSRANLSQKDVRATVGMTRDEVVRRIGKPVQSSDAIWVYMPKNPHTGREGMCELWFRNADRVEEVKC